MLHGTLNGRLCWRWRLPLDGRGPSIRMACRLPPPGRFRANFRLCRDSEDPAHALPDLTIPDLAGLGHASLADPPGQAVHPLQARPDRLTGGSQVTSVEARRAPH